MDDTKEKKEKIKYRVPAYYSGFSCTGGACEDTCCKDWRIEIDEASRERYRKVSGILGKRLKEAVTESPEGGWRFALSGRNCAFLNEEGLCDIQKELGAEGLCEACRIYPRHMEDFGSRRELMLSLSCPEAARQILGDKSQGGCRTAEKEIRKRGKEELAMDPDPQLLKDLLEARQTIICLLKDRSVGIYERLAMILSYAHDLQRHVNGSGKKTRTFWFQNLSERYLAPKAAGRFAGKLGEFRGRGKEREIRMTAWMRKLQNMEPVLGHWEKKQGQICTSLYHRLSMEDYQKLERSFEQEVMGLESEWENLFLYFINTYFLGACYDEDLYGKVKLSVFSLLIIREWCLFQYYKTGKAGREELVAAAYRYSREVENSDGNLLALEQLFQDSPLFGLRSMLTVLVGADRR